MYGTVIQSMLANAGIPMIFPAMSMMVVLLVPVVLIEMFVSRKLIKRESRKKTWGGVICANLVSTFVGWPIAWVVLVLIQMLTGGGNSHGLDSTIGILLSVTQQAPWLMPYESELYWMVPIAMGVLLVPFFFVSVYCERFVLRCMWTSEEKRDVKSFSWICHVYSYAFLFLFVIVLGLYQLQLS